MEKESIRISETGRKYHRHIDSRDRRVRLRLREVWAYRGLIRMFTRRSFVLTYKQTILGPLWILIHPLLSSVVQIVVFGVIARIGTDGIPMILFYLFGNAFWGFFATCVGSCASTFTGNAYLFGKVYFPRMTVPFSHMLSSLMHFLIQMIPATVLFVWFAAHGEVRFPGIRLLLIPFILLLTGLFGVGIGIIASSLTTRYRDLQVLVGFGLNLWMYITPVVYPLSLAAKGGMQGLLLWNPVTAPIELYRYALFGKGFVEPGFLLYSAGCTIAALLGGVMLFNRVERTFMDTV